MHPPNRTKLAIDDVIGGVRCWRIWWLLAYSDIRGRYRRSKFGQAWITLSMAITIAGIGTVYAAIFRLPADRYLPLVSVNLVVWGLISSLVNEGAGAFVESQNLLRGTSLPRSVFVLRATGRCILTFLHNLVLIPPVLLIFGVPLSAVQLLAIPGLLLLLATSMSLSLALATACLRFRDLVPIIASLMQLAFFLSPVIWERSQLAESQRVWADWNPLSAFLGIVRDPLLGRLPLPGCWTVASLTFALSLLASLVVFGRFRARVAFFA
jgi:ABC-type polysaccharide/polyol phosphate export permease